jgi:hypothetical protein
VSGFLAGKVWQSNLHPDLKPLAAALADIGNDDGTSIYPSVAYMAWLLGRSSRSVQQNLARLRDLGVLVIVDGGVGGRSKSTEYRLIESALPSREKWRKGAINSWFRKQRNHAIRDGKPRNPRTKPRSLRHETTNWGSPEPLVEPSGTGSEPASAGFGVESAEKLESDRSSSSSGKADDDSLLRPDWEARIQRHIEEARTLLLRKGWDPHLASAALQLIEERSDHSGSNPQSAEYFIFAIGTAMADPRDKAKILERAERRRRVMPSDELDRTEREIARESEVSGKPVREIVEARARARATAAGASR